MDVTIEFAGERLDRFIGERLLETSRAQVQEWIRAGRVQVDGVVAAKMSSKLRGGEVITVQPALRPQLKAVPENIEIEILYEDEDLAVVNKAVGMSVHAGAGQAAGTLVNALLHRFQSLSSAGGDLRPGIVHRLDRFTSGLLIVAKHDRAHRLLQDQFQTRQVDKRYWAVVEGPLPTDPRADRRLLRRGRPVMREGCWWLRLDMPIRRDRRNRVKMAVAADGRQAISEVRSLRSSDRYALVEVRIYTGRTHQIRVHLSGLGHPVVGDSIYGARRDLPEIQGLDRYLLHARCLDFVHPSTRARVRLEAPLPPDFEDRLAPLGL